MMKKHILLFLFLPQLALIGQNNNILTSFGIKAGNNFSKINIIQSNGLGFSVEAASILGFNAGFVFRHINEKKPLLGIQLEANLTQRGWKETSDTITDFYDRRQNYIEFPVLMNATLFKSKAINGILNLGFNTSFLLSDKETIEANAPRTRSYYHEDIKSSIDYGLIIGGGINMTLKNKKSLEFEIRYYQGLSDLFEPNDEFDILQHQIISFNLIYFCWVKD